MPYEEPYRAETNITPDAVGKNSNTTVLAQMQKMNELVVEAADLNPVHKALMH